MDLQAMYKDMEKYPTGRYEDLLEQKHTSEYLYHLSKQRGYLLEWYPFQSTDTVVELGAQAGSFTSVIGEKAGQVIALETDQELMRCNQLRNQNRQNIQWYRENLRKAKEKHEDWIGNADIVTCIDGTSRVKEIYGEPIGQTRFIQEAYGLVKPGGTLILGIDNRMGLRYWAGCQDVSTGRYFAGLEKEDDYGKGGKTRGEIERILKELPKAKCRWYYPYPDMTFPNMIYSDEYQPKVGELRTNLRNYDADRYILFQEDEVYDTLISDHLFCQFSNSFLILVRKEI